jgi:hypothetical protein
MTMRSGRFCQWQRFGNQIIRIGDAARTTEGFVEVILNAWNDATQDEAIVAWDQFRGSDMNCH